MLTQAQLLKRYPELTAVDPAVRFDVFEVVSDRVDRWLVVLLTLVVFGTPMFCLIVPVIIWTEKPQFTPQTWSAQDVLALRWLAVTLTVLLWIYGVFASIRIRRWILRRIIRRTLERTPEAFSVEQMQLKLQDAAPLTWRSLQGLADRRIAKLYPWLAPLPPHLRRRAKREAEWWVFRRWQVWLTGCLAPGAVGVVLLGAGAVKRWDARQTGGTWLDLIPEWLYWGMCFAIAFAVFCAGSFVMSRLLRPLEIEAYERWYRQWQVSEAEREDQTKGTNSLRSSQ